MIILLSYILSFYPFIVLLTCSELETLKKNNTYNIQRVSSVEKVHYFSVGGGGSQWSHNVKLLLSATDMTILSLQHQTKWRYAYSINLINYHTHYHNNILLICKDRGFSNFLDTPYMYIIHILCGIIIIIILALKHNKCARLPRIHFMKLSKPGRAVANRRTRLVVLNSKIVYITSYIKSVKFINIY